VSFLVPLVLSVALTAVARTVGLRLGVVDRPQPGPLKIHETPVSLLGGIAVVGSALGGLAVLGEWLPGAVVAAGVLALGTGLIDDVRPLPALARVAFLSLVGALLASGGFLVDPLGPLAAVGTVLLVLACANAVNIMDGQDGLAGGLSAIAAAGLAALAVRSGRAETAVLGLALAGGLAGFLVWNRPPARIFLGNGGAYAVGALLAAVVVDLASDGDWRTLLAAGACLGVFAMELVLTMARRLLASQSLVAGDRLHSYDILSRRVGNRTLVTVLFWALGVGAAALGLIIARLPFQVGVLLVAMAGAGSLSVGTWLWAAERRAVRRSP
jgi:UDP-GlcNAc:undecaprenyl-phosphate GlcNAc-1-phosphate transferase